MSAPSLPSERSVISLIRGWLRDRARAVHHLWRRSLQVRVVAMTMALGMVMLGVVGSYLYQQIAAGLVEERRQVAMAEAVQLTKKVKVAFDRTDKAQDQESLWLFARDIVQDAAGTERSRYVILLRLVGNTATTNIPPVVSGEVRYTEVPDALQEAVARDASNQHVQIVSVKLTGTPDPVSSIIVGQQVTLPLAGGYGIYYLYPMERERDSLAVVRTTLLSGGLVLVMLIGAVAYVVTRLVVAPVRRAAEVAERLAAGRLTERMESKGEDDLASLATSFNAMAEGLERQIGQLEDLSRVQHRFVSDVSHELRTPLTTIRMAVDLIYDSRVDFEPLVSRSAELLRGELDRFEALLSDLLEISRFDAGAAVLDVEATDIRQTVRKVVDAHQGLIEAKSTVVTIRDSGAPCVAVYDPRRVERILRNLVVNALEHGEGHPVEITVAGNDNAVAVTVRDQGVGLRAGDATRVFDRFWRADPARARTTGGTGLGLSIAVEDARLHAGRLEAWGMPGVGSCFRLTLPRSADVVIEESPLPLGPPQEGEGELALAPPHRHHE